MRRFILFGTLFGACILFALFAFEFSYRIPSDAKLASTFETHKEAFAKLQGMLASEPKDIIGMTSDSVMLNTPSNRASPEEAHLDRNRFSEYRKIMRANGISQFRRNDDEFVVLCGFSGWGFASHGPRFSYVHRDKPPNSQMKSLDDFKKGKAEWEAVYRPLSQNWYMRLVW